MDATQKRHKDNQGLSKFINQFIDQFVKDNPNMGFIIKYRLSDSEHPNQKSHLERLLIHRDKAHTYLISTEAHAVKSSGVDLLMPADIKTVPEWLLFNGEKTIEILETL